jgi:hypothetical protein
LHGHPERRRQPGHRRLWRVTGGSDEVGNPMGVGVGRESGSQVRPDRDPEVPRSGAPKRLRAVRRAGGASTRGEGESPTVERADPGGEEGQESIGPDAGLTVGGRERTLGWSKALKPPAPACPRWLRTGPGEPGRALRALRASTLETAGGLSPAQFRFGGRPAGGRRGQLRGARRERKAKPGSRALEGGGTDGGEGRDEVTRNGPSRRERQESKGR